MSELWAFEMWVKPPSPIKGSLFLCLLAREKDNHNLIDDVIMIVLMSWYKKVMDFEIVISKSIFYFW